MQYSLVIILGLCPVPHPHTILRVSFKYLPHLCVPYAKESLYLRFFIGEQGHFMHRALGLFELTCCGGG